jgi:hypothetical protein
VLTDSIADYGIMAQSIGMEALRDLTTEVSKSVEDVVRTATNHFNKFLVRLNSEDGVKHPYSSYAEINNKEYFTKEIFGLFTHYLLDDLKVKKCQTALGYLSKMKCQIERDMDLDLEKKKWYSDLRSKITTHYLAIASREGSKLVDSAPTMTERDLDLMCSCLLARGTREDLESRALLSWQWQSRALLSWITSISDLGRIVEEKVHAFFTDRQGQGPGRKRKRAIQPLAHATYKRFIGIEHRDLPAPSLVLDQATHALYNYNTLLEVTSK